MIITIIAIICSFALGSFVGVKCIQLGLKYQIQVTKGIEPELQPLKPIVRHIETVKQEKEIKKYNNTTAEMINDILNGGE